MIVRTIGAVWRIFKRGFGMLIHCLWVLSLIACFTWASFIIWMILTGQWSAGVFT